MAYFDTFHLQDILAYFDTFHLQHKHLEDQNVGTRQTFDLFEAVMN